MNNHEIENDKQLETTLEWISKFSIQEHELSRQEVQENPLEEKLRQLMFAQLSSVVRMLEEDAGEYIAKAIENGE